MPQLFASAFRYLKPLGATLLVSRLSSGVANRSSQTTGFSVRACLMDTIRIREATMYDKEAVLKLPYTQEDRHDPLCSQYEEHLLAPYRESYVAENAEGKLLGYFSASIIDGGKSVNFTPSRHEESHDDIPKLFHSHLHTKLFIRNQELSEGLGVYHSNETCPGDGVMISGGREVLQKHVLTLTLQEDHLHSQLEDLERKPLIPGVTKIVPSRVWLHLQQTTIPTLFPGEKMILCGEGYSVNKGNFKMLWGTKVRNVFLTMDRTEPNAAKALSFRNNYLAKESMVHYIDIFAQNDAQVFSHIVSQIHDSLRQMERCNVTHIFKVYVPHETDVNLVLATCGEHLKTKAETQMTSVSLVSYDLSLAKPYNIVEVGIHGVASTKKLPVKTPSKFDNAG